MRSIGIRSVGRTAPLFHILLGAVALALASCSSKPPPQARKVDPPVVRDTPAALKGTVTSLAKLQRADAVLISGYGLVVGVNGTGGGDLDTRIAATMERMLGLNEVGRNSDAFAGTPLEGKSPREVLRSKDVVVVIVYAAVVPGAPVGANFDVYVSAVNRSPDISLEGGMLWTTDLQLGPPRPFGGVKERQIAKAHGPIFINPFAEPGTRTAFGRSDGRVLSGGTVSNPLPLELVLDNESHSRVRAMVEAINNRFPEQPGESQTARGRSARVLEITVPSAYRERSNEFLNTLLHVQTDPSLPQEYARRYIETLKAQPGMADELRWCLQALPQRTAVPFLRDLYDYPELAPRLAALRAGSALDDKLAAPSLKMLAKEGPTPIRTEAIRLLGDLDAGPTVDIALREQLESDELSVRVAAYEALASRAEKLAVQRLLAQQERTPTAAHVSMPEQMASSSSGLEMPGNTPQGVHRRVIEHKFILDTIPGGKPMIYVTQQGRPRVVLFGDQLEISRPVLLSAWSGTRQEAAAPGAEAPSLARLVLTADTPTDQPRLLYRYPDRTDDLGNTIPGRTVTGHVSPKLPELIAFLAHTPTPEDSRPGLGMSYSEVVGALNEFQKGGAVAAHMAFEEDLLRLRLFHAAQQVETEDRPETLSQAHSLSVYDPVVDKTAPEGTPPKPPVTQDLVVPLDKPSKDGDKKKKD